VEALEEAGRRLRDQLAANILITRGEEGMALFNGDDAVTYIPTMAREVFDVTGAGDTVAATLTLALASGANTVEAAILANYAAGIVVGKVGTATATPEEILTSLEAFHRSDLK
jgi:D-glycero-beta-D-manno-heptose-7-phosphate kinase